MKCKGILTLVLSLGLAMQVWGQATKQPRVAPLTADFEREQHQMLQDGNQLDKVERGRYYRDSYGRTRLEMGRMIFISDPVAGISHVLDTQQRVAQVLDYKKLRAMKDQAPQVRRVEMDYTKTADPTAVVSAQPTGKSAADAANQSALSKQSLGQRVIEGVKCEGQQIIHTIAANSALGNSRPLTTTTEMWLASELLLPVLMVSEHPLTGKSMQRFKNIRVGSEPDPGLFRVPAEYKTVER